jgi:hypothetical protein
MIDSHGAKNETAEVFWYVYSIISHQNKHKTPLSMVGGNSLDRCAAIEESKFRRRLFNKFRLLLLERTLLISPPVVFISAHISVRASHLTGYFSTCSFFSLSISPRVCVLWGSSVLLRDGGISLSSRIRGESGTLCAPWLLVSCINIVNIFSAEKGQSCQSAKTCAAGNVSASYCVSLMNCFYRILDMLLVRPQG